MAKRYNGGLIGLLNPAKRSGVTGIWTSSEVGLSRIANLWPGVPTSNTFTSTSQFIIPDGVTTIDYLVVAGGGGGSSGGGGAGGVRQGTSLSVTPGGTLNIVIGAGGVQGSSNGSNSGIYSSSPFPALWGTGGGRGGANGPNSPGTDTGRSGGSGGGGSCDGFPSNPKGAGLGNLGGYTPLEGRSGGTGADFWPGGSGAGGGGGGGGVGINGLNFQPGAGPGGPPAAAPYGGNGGVGIFSTISGANVGYAGGGGGIGYSSTVARVFGYGANTTGGANGAFAGPFTPVVSGANAAPNFGGGGGGGTISPTTLYGSGGSGVVIIKWA
jgi:hypothetical protein